MLAQVWTFKKKSEIIELLVSLENQIFKQNKTQNIPNTWLFPKKYIIGMWQEKWIHV